MFRVSREDVIGDHLNVGELGYVEVDVNSQTDEM